MIRAAWSAFLLVGLVLAMSADAQESAQSPMDKATTAAANDPEFKKNAKSANISPSTVTSAIPDSPSEVALSDAATRQKYLAAVQRFYEYRANGYEYRSRVFEWQLSSSHWIFFVVLLLVIAGVIFAAIQFYVALVAARKGAAVDNADRPRTDAFATQLEISAKGVIVNSSVLGVIILALSLVFFYLYLVYVYPIKDVF